VILLLNRVAHIEDILEYIVQHRLIVTINKLIHEFLSMWSAFLNDHSYRELLEAFQELLTQKYKKDITIDDIFKIFRFSLDISWSV
jgi:hypothetical protein